MAKRIKLEFTENGTAAIAELLEDYAPETCRILWEALTEPATNRVIHAQWAGPEVVLELPESHRTFDPTTMKLENATATPSPGDIGWHYNYRYERHFTPEDYWNVAIFYGRDCYIHGAQITHWASIIENLAPFAEMCRRVRLEGLKEVTISRIDA
jgi:hypothetical protein